MRGEGPPRRAVSRVLSTVGVVAGVVTVTSTAVVVASFATAASETHLPVDSPPTRAVGVKPVSATASTTEGVAVPRVTVSAWGASQGGPAPVTTQWPTAAAAADAAHRIIVIHTAPATTSGTDTSATGDTAAARAAGTSMTPRTRTAAGTRAAGATTATTPPAATPGGHTAPATTPQQTRPSTKTQPATPREQPRQKSGDRQDRTAQRSAASTSTKTKATKTQVNKTAATKSETTKTETTKTGTTKSTPTTNADKTSSTSAPPSTTTPPAAPHLEWISATRVLFHDFQYGVNWDALAYCEAGNRPAAVNPSGKYRGMFQFDRATWKSVGGSGDPAKASPVEQLQRAKALYRDRGLQPWGCRAYAKKPVDWPVP